jgi:hypothetical protein
MLRATSASIGALAAAFSYLPCTANGQAQSLEVGYRTAIAESRINTGSVAGGPFLGFRLAHSRLPALGFEVLVIPSATSVRRQGSVSESHRERSTQAGISFRFSPPRRVVFFDVALGRAWVTYWETGSVGQRGPIREALGYVRLGTGIRARVGSHGPVVLGGLRYQWAHRNFTDGDYSFRKGMELIVGIGSS